MAGGKGGPPARFRFRRLRTRLKKLPAGPRHVPPTDIGYRGFSQGAAGKKNLANVSSEKKPRRTGLRKTAAKKQKRFLCLLGSGTCCGFLLDEWKPRPEGPFCGARGGGGRGNGQPGCFSTGGCSPRGKWEKTPISPRGRPKKGRKRFFKLLGSPGWAPPPERRFSGRQDRGAWQWFFSGKGRAPFQIPGKRPPGVC